MTSVRNSDQCHFMRSMNKLILKKLRIAMDTYNTEFNKDDPHPGNWEKMYVLVRYWRSDLEFYLEDLNFLTKLVKKYSIWVKRTDNSEEVEKMSAELQDIIRHGKALKAKLEEHQSKLAGLIDHKSNNSEVTEIEHEALEKEISEFVKNFRANRRNVFKVSEKVLDSENLSI